MKRITCIIFISIFTIALFSKEVTSRSLEHDMVLGKQKDIIRLLSKINNKECFTYAPTPFYKHYFLDLGIGKDEIFSIFNGDHAKDVKKLYDLFVQSDDYNEFYNRAVWARMNVNTGLFVYTFSAVVLMKKYTDGIILPPFYEINPHYFLNRDIIEKANASKNHTTINVDVSADDLRYFTEDIGVNSYYHFLNLLIPFWDTRSYPLINENGEFYIYLNQQLLARYNLERYALGLGPTSSYDYQHAIKLGYKCDLMYPNGELFPGRKDNSEISNGDVFELEMTNDTRANAYTYLKKFEDLLFETVTSSRTYSYYHLFDILGLHSNSENSGKLNFARFILGNPENKVQSPSALEHFETSLRDPMFWPMLKRMIYFYNKFSNTRPKNVNVNDFIHIKDVKIEKLVTYFDDFKIDLSNSKNTNTCEYSDIHANIKRLNHKPFNYTITFDERAPENMFVKVFIGPKYDRNGNIATLRHSRFDFFEIDRFLYVNKLRMLLSPGFYQPIDYIDNEFEASDDNNHIVIARTSEDNTFFGKDRTGFNKFYKNVINGFIEGDMYGISRDFEYYNFPKRLLLPKGSINGTKFQLYVIALPTNTAEDPIMVNREYDLHYPFNFPISHDEELLGKNAHLQEITIYHEE